jgi:hypothetical protein
MAAIDSETLRAFLTDAAEAIEQEQPITAWDVWRMGAPVAVGVVGVLVGACGGDSISGAAGECAGGDCTEECSDGIDNDGDGTSDCYDDDCVETESCNPVSVPLYGIPYAGGAGGDTPPNTSGGVYGVPLGGTGGYVPSGGTGGTPPNASGGMYGIPTGGLGGMPPTGGTGGARPTGGTGGVLETGGTAGVPEAGGAGGVPEVAGFGGEVTGGTGGWPPNLTGGAYGTGGLPDLGGTGGQPGGEAGFDFGGDPGFGIGGVYGMPYEGAGTAGTSEAGAG